MIVWLASYPRSGNTLLRTVLAQVFDQRSYSIYNDAHDIGRSPEVSAQVGHDFLDVDWRDFYDRERASQELRFVKTHNAPIDEGRAIYVVRDGRAAIVSWYNMLVRLRKRADVSIADIIRGEKVAFGDWSSHLRAWHPRSRRATLMLSFEQLTEQPSAAIDALAAFIGVAPVRPWHNKFDEMHRIFPEFFAGGANDRNIAQMSVEETELFWQLHGDCMKELRYAE